MSAPFVTVERTDPAARVLVVTHMWPHPDNPAYGIFIKRQVDSMIAAGCRCDVLFMHGYRSRLAYLVGAFKILATNFRRRRYALVHGQGGESAFAVQFSLRAPAVVTYVGDDLLGTPDAEGKVRWPHRVRRWVFRQHARLLAAAVTVSEEMKRTLPRSVQRRTVVVPQGIDRDLFRRTDRADARRELGWAEDERVVLFAADPAVVRKQYPLASAACEVASRELDGVRLHVSYPTPPERMPLLMSGADCLILTSVIEGSPNVVKEAMACDLPVVATPSGDVPELLARATPSWLREPDAEALGSALVECLASPVRSNGREATRDLGTEAIATRMLDLFAKVAPDSVAGS